MTSSRLLDYSLSHEYIGEIMDELPLTDLSSLMATGRCFRAVGQSAIKRDVHRLLQGYGLNAQLFRGLMRRTGMVLGGYTVLQFMLRFPTGSLSLEIFTIENAPCDGVKQLHEELLMCGYELMPVAESPRLGARQRRLGIAAVKKYARKPDGIKKGSRINVAIAEGGASILAPILCSPTTATMGYLTADSIHHLYPSWTFGRIARR
ncbi:hypothetical protein M407DRAFT_19287 [Tulasnella calospora MUT 4182]|uniref:F-box domain-containing protein n=1 Tax=Tulasnella calospora MUT 4182 TaxID=1051891 RepID=A0A0C3LCY5_9AGAM|nr:hypothetical protein M407DRAFT_19287 [Tulasnella calospora MUT 4182]